jgi:hypothetical protein
MSTYRRYRMLRSLYLDALHTEDYPFPPEKARPKAEQSASERQPPLIRRLCSRRPHA